MNKKELKKNGFKYIATQNNKAKIEVWAKFSGWEDVIQYYLYFPEEDKTNMTLSTISYSQLSLFEIMHDKLQNNFLKDNIVCKEDSFWYH